MEKIQKLDFLIAFYIFCIVVTELMGGKTIPVANIFGHQFNGSVSLFLLLFVYSINDIITEVYGKERTRSVVRSGLMMVFFLFIFTMLATWLPPSSRFIANEAAYDTIFKISSRLSAASLLAFGFAEFMDIFIYSKIRERFGKSKLWLRNNLSNFMAQLVDTVVFMTFAFYAFDHTFASNFNYLISLILPYWLLKCSVSVIETPFVYLGVKWLSNPAKNR